MFSLFLPLWCARMIRGAVQMPSVVRGLQRAAVHYKRAWLGLLCAHSIGPPAEGKISAPLVQMEGNVLTAFCTVILCSSAVVFCAVEHRHGASFRAGSVYRNVSVNTSRYPLYVMQLYQSFRMADSSSEATSSVGGESLQGSDSVLSLTAVGE